MRTRRFLAVVTAISAAATMFGCTAILGVTDVPDVAFNDVDGNEKTGDGAPGADAVDIVDAGPVCELASCAPVFKVPLSSGISISTFDGDGGNYPLSIVIGYPYPSDASAGFRIEMSLADATTGVNVDGPQFDVSQDIAIATDPIVFQTSGDGVFMNGYLTAGGCEAGAPAAFVYKASFDTVVSFESGDDAAAIGCSTYSSASQSPSGDSGSTYIAPLSVCFTSGNAGAQLTPSIINSVQSAAARYLETQSDQALIQAIELNECLSDYLGADAGKIIVSPGDGG